MQYYCSVLLPSLFPTIDVFLFNENDRDAFSMLLVNATLRVSTSGLSVFDNDNRHYPNLSLIC